MGRRWAERASPNYIKATLYGIICIDFLRGDSIYVAVAPIILPVTQGKTSCKANEITANSDPSVPPIQEVTGSHVPMQMKTLRGWSLEDLGNTPVCTQTISMVENPPMLVRM